MMAPLDEELSRFLTDCGLRRDGEPAHWVALSGGVSSDIWRVDLPGRSLCIKRALAKLRVAADWHAPVERNTTEWAWFETVGRIAPDAVPRLLAHDPAHGLFAMEYLAPADHPLWKARLLVGDVDVKFAGSVGDVLGRIHAATAGDTEIAFRFATDAAFHALRIEPYLLATAERHPELRETLREIAERTFAVHRALVHGDVSPKNILIGPKGPVFLDAETAWYGDPAFDLAFCLNHLVLKAVIRPDVVSLLADSFSALCEAYFPYVNWEPRGALESRAGVLLPALMLARADGKSPVEYLDTAGQDLVRRFARAQLKGGDTGLEGFYAQWRRFLEAEAR